MVHPDPVVDDKPISSRIKSVIPWVEKQFNLDDKETAKIKIHLNDGAYKEFEGHLHSLEFAHHPTRQNVSCGWHVLYWAVALIFFLLPLAYLFLIILQLALFNLIMMVVMIVWLSKFFRICRAIIKRCIDNSRTKHYRKFIKGLKELQCVTENSIEI